MKGNPSRIRRDGSQQPNEKILFAYYFRNAEAARNVSVREEFFLRGRLETLAEPAEGKSFFNS